MKPTAPTTAIAFGIILLLGASSPQSRAAETADIVHDDFSDPVRFEKDWLCYGFLASGITASNRHGTPAAGAKARREWWSIENGVLVGTRFPEEGHPSGLKRSFDPVDGDVRLSLRFRIPKEGKIGVALQGDNPVVERRFNIAGLAINRSQVIAWDNDVAVPKDSPEAAAMREAGKWNRKFFFAKVVEHPVAVEVWHDLEADLQGRWLTIRLDGKEVLRYETITGDVPKLGLSVSADTFGKPGAAVASEYDDIRLIPLPR